MDGFSVVSEHELYLIRETLDEDTIEETHDSNGYYLTDIETGTVLGYSSRLEARVLTELLGNLW